MRTFGRLWSWVAISLLSCGTSAQVWVFVSHNDRASYYFDRDSIKSDGKLVTAWRLSDFFTPTTSAGVPPIWSVISQDVFDCAKEEMGNRQRFAYSGHTGSGDLLQRVDRGVEPERLAEPIPGTVDRMAQSLICDWWAKKMKSDEFIVMAASNESDIRVVYLRYMKVLGNGERSAVISVTPYAFNGAGAVSSASYKSRCVTVNVDCNSRRLVATEMAKEYRGPFCSGGLTGESVFPLGGKVRVAEEDWETNTVKLVCESMGNSSASTAEPSRGKPTKR